MPPLLAPAIGALALGAGITISSAVATGIAYGITTIATIGAQFAFNRLTAKRGKKGDPQITAVTIKQPIPVRTRAYGICKLGGALFYEDATPLQYQPLVLGIVHCEGPVDGFQGFYLNESNAGIVGNIGVNLALPWGPYITLQGKEGTDSQTTAVALAAKGFTGVLNGLCYTVMQCAQMYRPDKYFQYYYPNGVPKVSAVIRTSKIYDPRLGQDWDDPSTWTFSRNPAIIAMDFLTYYKTDASGRKIPRGMGLPHSRINVQSFIDFANMCDAIYTSSYSLNPYDGSVIATSRNEPRYQCDGAYQLDETPTDVLNRILATCDGTLYTDENGLVCIRGGSWTEPTVIINDAMIISCDISKGNGKFETFNRVKISFTATNMDYQVVEGHPFDNELDIDVNGILSEDLSLPYVQSYSQARRLAKISAAKGNPEWHYNSLVCNMSALNVIGEEFIRVTHSLPGIDGPFLVHSVKIMFDRGQVELQLSSIDPDGYSWNPSVEDFTPPSPQGGTG